MTIAVTAVRLTEPGAPPTVTRVEPREPAGGEVVVDMCFASLNPLDTYVMSGSVGAQAEWPRTLGVEGVGLHDGRPVVVHGAGLGVSRDGTWATRVVAPRDALVSVPDGVDLEAAASAAVVGTTAVRVTGDVDGIGATDRVLVLGAAGGVGQAVCSLAHFAGARVWGQTATPEKEKAVEAAGAAPIRAGTAEELALAAESVVPTVVFDALGGAFTATAVHLLADYGRLVSYGTSAAPDSTLSMRAVYRKNLTIAGYGGVAEPPQRIREGTAEALRALREGSMVIPVHAVYPIARAASAVAALTARTAAGKILLDLRHGTPS